MAKPNQSAGLTRLPARQRCRHCKSRKVSKPRGLCYVCHTTETVRAMYPPTCSYGRAGAAGAMGTAVLVPDRPAERPSPYRPGTVGKFLDLCNRYATGQQLWHPNDARA